jgi:D-alanine-D-alanine ligase
LVEDFRQSAEEIIHALETYPKLLAERKIEGREFTVGILGTRALPVVELKPKGKFYDYHCKYTAGMTEYLVPAPIPESWRRRFQRVALQTHEALGLRDFSRVDLVADTEGKPFVLEANTIPGFTELSLLPKAAREAGISFDELCKTLIGMAGKRRERAGRNHGKT